MLRIFRKKRYRKHQNVFFLYTKHVCMCLVIIIICGMSIFFPKMSFFCSVFALCNYLYINIKKMKKQLKTIKIDYMAPQVEAMDARVERGYFLSSGQNGNATTEEVLESGSALWG